MLKGVGAFMLLGVATGGFMYWLSRRETSPASRVIAVAGIRG